MLSRCDSIRGKSHDIPCIITLRYITTFYNVQDLFQSEAILAETKTPSVLFDVC